VLDLYTQVWAIKPVHHFPQNFDLFVDGLYTEGGFRF